MGWTRRANPRWANWRTRKEADYSISYDRHGNTKRNHWATTWTTGSTRWCKRLTNRQHRIAASLQIAHELEMYEEELQALWEDQWYDDDYDDSYFDDWGDNCYEYPEPEPEPEYEPFDDPYWFRYYNGDY